MLFGGSGSTLELDSAGDGVCVYAGILVHIHAGVCVHACILVYIHVGVCVYAGRRPASQAYAYSGTSISGTGGCRTTNVLLMACAPGPLGGQIPHSRNGAWIVLF